jgi:putative membrane protein
LLHAPREFFRGVKIMTAKFAAGRLGDAICSRPDSSPASRITNPTEVPMSTGKVLKQVFEISALVFTFGTTAVHAQADKSAPGAASSAPQAGSSATTAAPTAPGKAMSKSDQQMMRDIAQANLSEIEAGKTALSKSSNSQVKSFAQRMIDDHTKASQEVQQLAQAKGVTLPTEPDSKHKAMVQKLSGLSGDAFDRRYMEQAGVSDHKKTHALLKRVQAKASDPDLKQLAAKTLPTVDDHLSMAQQLHGGKAASTGSGSGSSGSGTSGSGTSGSSK